jgi:hypothetical protein
MSERDNDNDDAAHRRRRRQRLGLFETWVKRHVQQQQQSAGASVKSFPIYVKTEHSALVTSDGPAEAPVPFVSAKAVGALSADIGETFYDAAVRTLGAATVRALVDGGWLADPATAASARIAADDGDDDKAKDVGEKQKHGKRASEGGVSVVFSRRLYQQHRPAFFESEDLRFDLYRRVFIDGAYASKGGPAGDGAATPEQLLALADEMSSSELSQLVDVLLWMNDRSRSRKLRAYAADVDAPESDSERIDNRRAALRAFQALYAASRDGKINSETLDVVRRSGDGDGGGGGDGAAQGDAVVKAMIVAGREAGAVVQDVQRAAGVRVQREKGARDVLSPSIVKPEDRARSGPLSESLSESAAEDNSVVNHRPEGALPPLVPLEGRVACPTCGGSSKKKYAPGEGRVACAHCGGRKGAQSDAAPAAKKRGGPVYGSDDDDDGSASASFKTSSRTPASSGIAGGGSRGGDSSDDEGVMACAHCGGSGKVRVRKALRAREGATACHHTLCPLSDSDAAHEPLVVPAPTGASSTAPAERTYRGQTLFSAEGPTSCATCRHHALHPLDEVPADVVKATGNVVAETGAAAGNVVSETGAAVGSAVGKTVAAIRSPFT